MISWASLHELSDAAIQGGGGGRGVKNIKQPEPVRQSKTVRKSKNARQSNPSRKYKTTRQSKTVRQSKTHRQSWTGRRLKAFRQDSIAIRTNDG